MNPICLFVLFAAGRQEIITTVTIAPMTTKGREYPTRAHCTFEGIEGQVVLDQIRTVDKVRLVRRLGKIDAST